MDTKNQTDLLAQAQAARDSGNWSFVTQCLQQLIAKEQASSSNRSQLLLGDAETAQVIDLALEVLVAGDFQQQWDIAKLFPKLGQTVITPLLEILEDEDADEELRWFAGRILGEFNHPTVIAALVEMLKTAESEELSTVAAAALGQIGSLAVAALTELLTEENTRLLAVQALSQIRRSETIAPLLSVVEDPQIAVRAAAIEALSSFHDPKVPPVLLKALNDLAALVRREAVIGLGFRSDLREELDLVNQLAPRLYDFNLDVCTMAAIALGRLGTDAAAIALFQVLQSLHTPVSLQIEVVRALSRVETQTSLEYLHQAWSQPLAVPVQQEIVTVLGRVEQPELKTEAAKILIDFLRSSHPATQPTTIKQGIALSLGQLGEIQAIDNLIELLAETDLAVRLHVITALKQINSAISYQKLEKMSSKEALAPELKTGVAIALQEWTTPNDELS